MMPYPLMALATSSDVFMESYLLWTLVSVGIWGAIVWGIATLQLKLMRTEGASPTLVTCLTLADSVAFCAVASVPFATPILAGRGPDSAMQHVVAHSLGVALIGYMILASTRARHLRAFQTDTSGETAKPRGGSLLAGVGLLLVYVTIGNWFTLHANLRVAQGDAPLAMLTFAVLGMILGYTQRTVSKVGAKGALVPVEDSPLGDELRAVASHFGEDGSRIRVQTTRSERANIDDMTREQVAVAIRTWTFDRRNPSIPIELMQRVEPREVTAAVALRYALSTSTQGSTSTHRMLLLFLLSLVLLVVMLFLYAVSKPLLGGATPVLMIVAGIAAFFSLIQWGPGLFGTVRPPEDNYIAAHRAWAAAAPEEPRDFVAFTKALLAQDRLSMMLGPEADLVPLVEKNLPIVRAAGLVAGLSPGDYLARLREPNPATHPQAAKGI